MAILFVDNLTNIDFSYFHPKRGVVGESLLLDIALEGTLDEQSMVLDFGLVKPFIKSSVESLLDHKFIIPRQHKSITFLDKSPLFQRQYGSSHTQLHLQDEQGFQYWLNAPSVALAILDAEVIDDKSLTQAAIKELQPKLRDNIQQLHLHLHPEAIDGAFYHYSHGLKKHDGACQRIVHGHRSRIQIFDQHGQRSQHWENYWANEWRDIYLGSQEDVLTTLTLEGQDSSHFAYEAPEGWFEWIMPTKRCRILPSDTTVECIADFLSQQLGDLDKENHYRVKAYEGINKGALA